MPVSSCSETHVGVIRVIQVIRFIDVGHQTESTVSETLSSFSHCMRLCLSETRNHKIQAHQKVGLEDTV